MTEMATQLPALTLSPGLLAAVIEAGPAEPGKEASATDELLRAAAAEARKGGGGADPQRVVKDRLAQRVRELCPDLAPTILRARG